MAETLKNAGYIATAALGLAVVFSGIAKSEGPSDMSWAEAGLAGGKALGSMIAFGAAAGGASYCVGRALGATKNDGVNELLGVIIGGFVGLTAGCLTATNAGCEAKATANTSQKVSAVVSPTGETALVLPAARWTVPAA